jgi:hypothetical protein
VVSLAYIGFARLVDLSRIEAFWSSSLMPAGSSCECGAASWSEEISGAPSDLGPAAARAAAALVADEAGPFRMVGSDDDPAVPDDRLSVLASDAALAAAGALPLFMLGSDDDAVPPLL